ncbi:MAG TPA: CHAP domain-containing protein [Caulobacteraceae bacterium]
MRKRLVSAAIAMALGVSTLAATPSAAADSPYWQCVTFARMFSGIQIFGDAWTWWNQAVSNRLRTGTTPEIGSVLVFQPSGRMTRGHVAVVSQILTDRVVRVTHANWGGSRGRVEENVTMVDVSPRGDWTQVRVWYNPLGDLGTSVYPTYGFIYQTARDAGVQVASAGRGSAAAGQP